MTTLKERFDDKFKVIEELKNIPDTVTVGTLVKDFFRQELLALAEEIDEIIVPPEVWKKMKDSEQFETIGGNAGTRRASGIIRSKAYELN